jgi:L-threonylcarbamoyladenylate synthase
MLAISLTESELIVVALLKNGAVGVMPTDTIYGLVGSALEKKTVERIYRFRKRNLKKPMIILIASLRDLGSFGVVLGTREKMILKKVWPGKVSVVLKCSAKKFAYLHRGTKSLAFRMPDVPRLRAILAKTGPLVAPSANFEGEPPARTILEAKRYFGEKVEFYGTAQRKIVSKPSTLIAINKNGGVSVLRKGAVKIPFVI